MNAQEFLAIGKWCSISMCVQEHVPAYESGKINITQSTRNGDSRTHMKWNWEPTCRSDSITNTNVCCAVCQVRLAYQGEDSYFGLAKN